MIVLMPLVLPLQWILKRNFQSKVLGPYLALKQARSEHRPESALSSKKRDAVPVGACVDIEHGFRPSPKARIVTELPYSWWNYLLAIRIPHHTPDHVLVAYQKDALTRAFFAFDYIVIIPAISSDKMEDLAPFILLSLLFSVWCLMSLVKVATILRALFRFAREESF